MAMYSLWVYLESSTFLIIVFYYGKYMFLNAWQQSVEQHQIGRGYKSTEFEWNQHSESIWKIEKSLRKTKMQFSTSSSIA